MSTFATLAFEDQLARIAAVIAGGGDARPLVREAAALPDAEPLARVLEALVAAGRLDAALEAELEGLTRSLEDAALQHLWSRPTCEELSAVLERIAERALSEWPIERISALAFLTRWLRRRAPDAHARVLARAEAALDGDPPVDGSPLLHASGARLASLARDARWGDVVRDTLRRAIDALARAPKSISQVHAERLLGRRVYADPGHFLFELLQNADDAGAGWWSAAIERDRVVLRHDGAPFSLLDLVGVLSIGQTTKRADQIGFFGVGFKSIYEVCERPRIHSGALDVEIAHVSIPRALGPSASTRRDEETVLVLPYRSGEVDAAALHRRALALPPEILLWLPHLRAIDVRGPDGSSAAWRQEHEGRAHALRFEGPAAHATRRYRVASRELHFEGAREPGRAHTSAVSVAIALDASGAPTATEGATLYAFLPTAERTGLRAVVHARFDVTLDRERLELGSAWNDALLAAAGAALAELIAALASEGASVLDVISPEAELAPVMAPLARALRDGLRGTPCLPDAAGGAIAPSRSRSLEPALARALAGLDLGEGTRALAPLSAREREVAAWLGARAFDAHDLVAWIATRCAEGDAPPPWLGDAVLDVLARSPAADDVLRALPILVDTSGRLARAADARRAPSRWAALYRGERGVVSDDALATWPPVLRARLAIAPLDADGLARDLRDEVVRARLLAHGDALFDVLVELDDATLRSLDDVPLLPRQRTGASEPVARASGIARLDPALAPLASSLARELVLLEPTFASRHAALTRRWLPAFELGSLADALASGLALDEPALDALTALLDRAAPALPRDLARRMAALPLFRDRHGARRPLLGASRALLGSLDGPDLAARLPSWPWLEAPHGAFTGAVDPPRVDARALASALAGLPADLPAISTGELAPALEWLGARAGELPAALVSALASATIWLDRGGTPRALDALRRGTASAALEALYAATGGRHVASGSALALVRALGLDARLPTSDHAALIGDLVRDGVPEGAPRDALLSALVEAAASLSDAALAPLARVAAFEDERGTLRPLAAWSSPDPRACHRAGAFREVLRAAGLPLLSASDEARLAPLLERIAPPPATAADVVRQAPALARDPAALLSFLDAHEGALDAAARDDVAALPIFASRAGTEAPRRPAHALCARASLAAVLGEARVDALGLADALLAPDDEARITRWGLASRPVAALLEERVLPALREDGELASQPAPWTSRAALDALARLAGASGLDLLAWPLALDAQARVVTGPLWIASDATRAVVARLELASRLADPAWAEGLPPGSPLVRPLPPRRVAEALREACPEEAPREDHPIVRDLDALHAWLREASSAIEVDGPARDALAVAAVFPSQRGTLRAARDLVLDPGVPDVGLGWGLAPDVPEDVARWLRATFELDRRARRALVAHVLDGLDEARAADDRPRAAQLVAFLASALGAGEVAAAELEERARRLDVRARMRVPLAGGGWDKPRFAWAPSDLAASRADAFALDLPPRIALPGDDARSALLLAACGAKDDLDDATVVACLDGRGVREGAAPRRALARYVTQRALEAPERAERWGLAARAWLPSSEGVLRRPRELVWPDAAARALLGDRDPLLPDPEVVFDFDDAAAARLGLRRAESLSLGDVAARARGREAHPALLAWLEQGLRDGRFGTAEVRAALAPTAGDTILLRDDEGRLRRPREVAARGAHLLFGRWRGDARAAREHPRLARALGIPDTPDAAMIAAFLCELGAALEGLGPSERDALAQRLPECLVRFDALAPVHDPVPVDAALAALRAGRVVLLRLGDPALRMRAPDALARALDEVDAPRSGGSADDADPLPLDREPGLTARLLASGVPDLWTALRVREVVSGPRLDALDGHAEALRAGIAVTSPAGSFAQRAAAHEALAVRGEITLAGRSIPIVAPVDAWLDDDVLRLTPAALADPALLAPVLAPEPERRGAMAAWLDEGHRAGRWAPSPELPRPASAPPREDGLVARLRRLFTAAERAPEPPRASPPPPRAEPPLPRARDERFFRPEPELRSQLDESGGWLESRREVPELGLVFSPPRLEAPWLYAPKLVASRFDRGGQRWTAAHLPRPEPRGDAGMLVMRGRLPAGESVLPVPLYGRVVELRAAREEAAPVRGASGATGLHLEVACEVRMRVSLGRVPDLDRARPARGAADALASYVPDDELPDEVHAQLDELGASLGDAPAVVRALAIRDFVRERYRYDPSYLEDPSVARWLARITQGRAHAHVAALHAGRDATHLGAGVCFELNALACELLRRAGIPAVLATGWVLDGGALSEPDHLWAIALLEDDAGAPVWVPIDASTTREGRPLRVPRRPPVRFRAPRDPDARAPAAPRWDLGGAPRQRAGERGPKKKRARVPEVELRRVLHHLAQLTGRTLDEPERAALERALSDPRAAAALLERMRGR